MDLERAAAHVAHDARRLREAYDRRQDWAGWTSWYVFARNLAQFFESSRRREDYILATDFIEDDEDWRTLVREHKRVYSVFMGHASALANHLSFLRVRLEDQSGESYAPSGDVTEALEALYHGFLKRLPSDRREWFTWEPRSHAPHAEGER